MLEGSLAEELVKLEVGDSEEEGIGGVLNDKRPEPIGSRLLLTTVVFFTTVPATLCGVGALISVLVVVFVADAEDDIGGRGSRDDGIEGTAGIMVEGARSPQGEVGVLICVHWDRLTGVPPILRFTGSVVVVVFLTGALMSITSIRSSTAAGGAFCLWKLCLDDLLTKFIAVVEDFSTPEVGRASVRERRRF